MLLAICLYFYQMENKVRIQQAIQESIETKQLLLQEPDFADRMQQAANMLVQTLTNQGKVHFCGNGGSAADAQHLAAELSGRFYYDRPPLNAEALHCNSSYMTAVGNDYGYEYVFSRLLLGTGREGDVLIGISTSGNSANIIRAYEVCKEKGIRIISFTGKSGGKMREFSDILFNVPSTDTPRIQESHIMIGHILCELVEKILFPKQ